VASPLLSAKAHGLRDAIFDFELIDTSLEGVTNRPRVRLDDQLRVLVTSSGKLEVIDIAPERAEAHKASLQACGDCDADSARKPAAELSITGTVQKVSGFERGLHTLPFAGRIQETMYKTQSSDGWPFAVQSQSSVAIVIRRLAPQL
jgi:hypothetical protein